VVRKDGVGGREYGMEFEEREVEAKVEMS